MRPNNKKAAQHFQYVSTMKIIKLNEGLFLVHKDNIILHPERAMPESALFNQDICVIYRNDSS